jgi:hypothetical protein
MVGTAVTLSLITCAKNSGILLSDGFRTTLTPMRKAQLTFEQIHEIRTCGLTDAFMARKLGASPTVVTNARRGISFKDHPTPPDTAYRKPGGKRAGPAAVASDKNCGKPALTSEAVHLIRTSGLPDERLADQLGVSRTLVTKTRRGQIWQEHPTPPDRFPRKAGQQMYTGNERLLNAPSLGSSFTPNDRVLFDRLRMWCRVDEDGCWIWTGSFTCSTPRPSGHHGVTSINGESISSHRAMWVAVHGEIPEGICICHTCDKPPCIHPFHLWPGTHADNMRDSILKGRHITVRDRE